MSENYHITFICDSLKCDCYMVISTRYLIYYIVSLRSRLSQSPWVSPRIS